MSTQYADEQTARGYPQQEHRGGCSDGPPPRRRRAKPFFLTSEFLTMLAAIAALAIAGAVADGFDAKETWTLITIVAAAYIVSRGLSKIGRGDGDIDR